jgi:hypothetical protein
MLLSINDIFFAHGENEEIGVRILHQYMLDVSSTSTKNSSISAPSKFQFQLNDLWWHSKLELVQESYCSEFYNRRLSILSL